MTPREDGDALGLEDRLRRYLRAYAHQADTAPARELARFDSEHDPDDPLPAAALAFAAMGAGAAVESDAVFGYALNVFEQGFSLALKLTEQIRVAGPEHALSPAIGTILQEARELMRAHEQSYCRDLAQQAK